MELSLSLRLESFMSNADFDHAQPQKQPLELPAAANPFRETEVEKVASIFEAEIAHEDYFAHFTPRSQPPAPPVFHVPKRFGVSAIWGITTVLAILFGLLRSTGAPALAYWFFAILSLFICIAQMRFGEVPRQASLIAGALLMPVFVIGAALFENETFNEDDATIVFISIFAGAFFGYLTGTCLGGVFLLMNMLEKLRTRPINDRADKTISP